MPIEEDERGTAILSSRDICMMEHLPRLMESGVCCFKIEGRMKTEIYIATVVGAYRRAMDAYAKSPADYRRCKGGCAGSWTRSATAYTIRAFTSASRRSAVRRSA